MPQELSSESHVSRDIFIKTLNALRIAAEDAFSYGACKIDDSLKAAIQEAELEVKRTRPSNWTAPTHTGRCEIGQNWRECPACLENFTQ